MLGSDVYQCKNNNQYCEHFICSRCHKQLALKNAVKPEVQRCHVPIVFTMWHSDSVWLHVCVFLYDSFTGCLTSVRSNTEDCKWNAAINYRQWYSWKLRAGGGGSGRAFAQNDVWQPPWKGFVSGHCLYSICICMFVVISKTAKNED